MKVGKLILIATLTIFLLIQSLYSDTFAQTLLPTGKPNLPLIAPGDLSWTIVEAKKCNTMYDYFEMSYITAKDGQDLIAFKLLAPTKASILGLSSSFFKLVRMASDDWEVIKCRAVSSKIWMLDQGTANLRDGEESFIWVVFEVPKGFKLDGYQLWMMRSLLLPKGLNVETVTGEFKPGGRVVPLNLK